MLNFGNKEFRNLQEQVLKNAQDIETLKGRKELMPVIVNELPEVGNPNYIYLLAKDDGETPDVYDEYIWLEDEERYEKIGGVSIDLSNFVTLDSEQTITGTKKFSFSPLPTADDTYDLGSSLARWKDFYLGGKFYTGTGTNQFIYGDAYDRTGINNSFWFSALRMEPMGGDNAQDIGTSSNKIKDIYLGGKLCAYDPSYSNTNYWHVFATNQFNLTIAKNGVNRFLFQSNQFSPADYQNPQCNLGSINYAWKDAYIMGILSDGVNSVTVANIASKVTSTFISGTFDANGESTIDTEQAGTPEGLFIFTYGNCQCFLRLTATMVNSADTAPIRVSCPMIYNGATSLGWLNITKSGTILILTITDGTNHVDSGYAWTLTKTNLI